METKWKQKVAGFFDEKNGDDVSSQSKKIYKNQLRPNVTNSLNGNTLETKKSHFFCQKYDCIFCDYSTSKKSDYEKHITTRKHKMCDNYGVMETCRKKVAACNCGKTFATRSGMWKHHKKCGAGWKEMETTMVSKPRMLLRK